MRFSQRYEGKLHGLQHGGNKMNNIPTPRTEAVMVDPLSDGNDLPQLARQLETELSEALRERDEARVAFVIATDQMVVAQCKLRESNKERDEAQEAIRILAHHGASEIQRIAQERDEARSFLREIATASHFDNIGNWAKNKAKKALEGAK